MKIDSYNLTTTAQRSYQKAESQTTTLEGRGSSGGLSMVATSDAVTMEFSQTTQTDAAGGEAAALYDQYGNTGVQQSGGIGGVRIPTNQTELKAMMLQSLLRVFSKGRFKNWDVRLAMMNQMGLGGGAPSIAGRTGHLGTLRRVNSGITVTASAASYERETMDYNAKGVVKTADGKSISIDLSLHMSREFVSYAETSMNFGGAAPIDPLVINYAGSAASLTQTKYDFDLNFDGKMDSISFAGPGSGFLALDKNGDGTINDGSELFGPASGSGFGELRGHDADGNNWIDESDEIFSQLRIWSKDEKGNDQLFTLQQLGIGAIYLGDVETQFSLNDEANNQQGVMRSTSFFLTENGRAGTVHHIDLTV